MAAARLFHFLATTPFITFISSAIVQSIHRLFHDTKQNKKGKQGNYTKKETIEKTKILTEQLRFVSK